MKYLKMCLYLFVLTLVLTACSGQSKVLKAEKIDSKKYCEEISSLREYISIKGNEVEQLNSAITFSTQIKSFIKTTAPKSEIKLWNDIANFEYDRGIEEIDLNDANKIIPSYEKINSIIAKRCNIDFFDIPGSKSSTTTTTSFITSTSFPSNGAFEE